MHNSSNFDSVVFAATSLLRGNSKAKIVVIKDVMLRLEISSFICEIEFDRTMMKPSITDVIITLNDSELRITADGISFRYFEKLGKFSLLLFLHGCQVSEFMIDLSPILNGLAAS